MDVNLETERLCIRPVCLKDADFIMDLVNSESWLKFIGNRNIYNRADAEHYIKKLLGNTSIHYHVFELKASQKPIGIVTFIQRSNEKYPDIGFALLPDYEKNGYTLEASQSYLDQVKKSNTYENIIAFTMPENKPSIRLLQRLGFQYDGDRQKGKDVLSYFSLR